MLESDVFRVRLDRTGVIRSILDLRHDREVLPPTGAANLLELHPDRPNRWDAWDLDAHYRHTVTSLIDLDELRVEDDVVVVRRSFGASTVEQRIALHLGRIEIDTDVDWHERERVLKLAVDCDVHADEARYETQFGHVVRPTHLNTSWDAARFEVCAHRWALVAEEGYAVALANRTTYGHDVTRHQRPGGGTYSRIRASLLRAPRFPDPDTDQGRHSFRHAIVPGADVAAAARAGYGLNLPLRRRAVDRSTRSSRSRGTRRTSRRSSSPRTVRATWWSGSTSRWAPGRGCGWPRPSRPPARRSSTSWSVRSRVTTGTAPSSPCGRSRSSRSDGVVDRPDSGLPGHEATAGVDGARAGSDATESRAGSRRRDDRDVRVVRTSRSWSWSRDKVSVRADRS